MHLPVARFIFSSLSIASLESTRIYSTCAKSRQNQPQIKRTSGRLPPFLSSLPVILRALTSPTLHSSAWCISRMSSWLWQGKGCRRQFIDSLQLPCGAGGSVQGIKLDVESPSLECTLVYSPGENRIFCRSHTV